MALREEVRIELPVSRSDCMRERVFVRPHDRVPSTYRECLWSEARAFNEDGVNDGLFHSDDLARGHAHKGRHEYDGAQAPSQGDAEPKRRSHLTIAAYFESPWHGSGALRMPGGP